MSNLSSAAPWTNKLFLQEAQLLDRTQFAGLADNLLPLFGNDHNIFYLDGSFAGASKDAYLSSIGMGSRFLRPFVSGHEIIFGGFAFADYQHTPQSTAWYVNPGVELFTIHQDIRFQYYIPATHAVQAYDHTMASMVSSSLDNGASAASHTYHSGHTAYDTPVSLVNEYGTGFELEGSQSIFMGNWIRAGVYHYTFPSSPTINGAEVNIEITSVKNVSIHLQDNYDNQKKNFVTLSFSITFGGYNDGDSSHLQNRMEERVRRHIAREPFALISPIYNKFTPTDSAHAIASNNWYFSRIGTDQGPTITLANCTAEHPCLNLDQDIASGIQTIQPGAQLYFAPGTYALSANPAITGNPNAVILGNGQSIWGRTYNWSSQASGSERALIQGSLFWGNNNNGVIPTVGSGFIDSMQITNLDNHIPVSVSGYTPAGGGSGNAAIAVGAIDNLTISNSLISATGSTAGAPAIGGWTLNGNISAANTTINANTTGQGLLNSTDYFSYGLLSQNGFVSLSTGTINSSTQGDFAESYGLFSATQDVIGTNVNMNVSTTGQEADAFGIYAASGNVTLHSTQSNGIQVHSAGQNANASGILTVLQNVQVSDSVISATTTGNNAIAKGIWAEGTSSATIISGTTVTASSTGVGAFSYGVQSNTIDFTNLGSLISASSLLSTAIPIYPGSVVSNYSTPLSLCQINGGVKTVC